MKAKFIYTTYSGTIFNLTPENQKLINFDNVHFLFPDFIRMENLLKKLPSDLTFKKFLGFPENVNIFLSPITQEKKRVRGCDDSDKVEFDSFGFKKISNSKYLEIAQFINPNIFCSLTEDSRQDYRGKKSLKRNIKKSVNFLKESIELKKNLDLKFKIAAPFQGSNFKELRIDHLEELKSFQNDFDYLVLYGLFDKLEKNENKKEEDEYIDRKGIIDLALQYFPEKQLILSSDGDFLNVLQGRMNKVFIFESFYPFKLSKINSALNIDLNKWPELLSNSVNSNYFFTKSNISEIIQTKKVKTIKLDEKQFENDLNPLEKNCKCHTCTTVSRAYIYHLINHHEMNANILLTIHNCFVNQEFFKYLNEDIISDNLESAIKIFVEFFTENN